MVLIANEDHCFAGCDESLSSILRLDVHEPNHFWALAQIRPISCETRIFPNLRKLPRHPSGLPVVWERSIGKAEILSTPVSADLVAVAGLQAALAPE